MDELNVKMMTDISNERKQQEKINDHLMDAQTQLQKLMADYNTEADGKIESQNKNMKLMHGELEYLQDLVKMGRGGRIVDQICDIVKEAVDKGPITEIREQYAPRAQVEKDIMKVQNQQRKLQDELKHVQQMR